MELNRLLLCSLIVTIISLIKCSSGNQLPTMQVSSKIAQLLDSIYALDQHYRQKYESSVLTYGHDSAEVKLLASIINKVDSVNLVEIKSILDQYGWLGPETVGEKGNNAIFFVIQHSDKETRKQYLPMMREAVKNGKASTHDLALLEDRAAIDEGKKQIYGTQLRFDRQTKQYQLLQLKDPENVDTRRKKAGLIPLSEYLKEWGINDWSPESQ
jgi:hypothetical protein